MKEFVEHIGNYVLLSIVPPINLFVVFYFFRSNWRATEPGRALMLSKVSLLLLVDIAVATVIFGRDYPGREWVRLFVFLIISISQWRLFIILIRVQNAFLIETREEKDLLKNKKGDDRASIDE